MRAAFGRPAPAERHRARRSKLHRGPAPAPVAGAHGRRDLVLGDASRWAIQPEAEPIDWTTDRSATRRPWLLVGAVTAMAALAGGILAARATKDPPVTPAPVAVGTRDLAIVRPAAWRTLRPGPAVPGLDRARQVAVGPPRARGGRPSWPA